MALNEESNQLLNLLSTSIAASSATVANATVDMSPYFNVLRREVAMVYTIALSSTLSETFHIVLQGSDSTAAANSTSTTLFTDIAGSSVTSTLASSLTNYNLTVVQPLMLKQRYLRAAVAGSASTAAGFVSVAILLTRRNAM